MLNHDFTLTMFTANVSVSSSSSADAKNGSDESNMRVEVPKVLNLDKSGTTGGQEKKIGSQVTITKGLASHVSFLAERTGFEPADQLPGHGFSKPALSTTQPPLRIFVARLELMDQVADSFEF